MNERKRKRKSLRSCVMCWGEIYRNDLPGSFEIHKVINSRSAFSRAKQKLGHAAVCADRKSARKGAGPNWIGAPIVSGEIVTVGRRVKKWPSADDLEEGSG